MRKEFPGGDSLVIGRIASPRGLRGDLKIHSYSGETAHFLKLKEATLSAPQRAGETRSDLLLKVLRVEETGGGLVMAFAGYPTPEAARALVGMEIHVARGDAAPLRHNEWYIADLVGCELVHEGRALARVEAVLEGGPDPLLEARLIDGRKALVPFRSEFVGRVDPEAGAIELAAPWVLE